MQHTDILASLSSDQLPILVSLTESVVPSRISGLWKFNCFLLHNAKFKEEMKNHIAASLKNFDE